MNHLEGQNFMAEYVEMSISQETKTVHILQEQTFLQTSENCRCPMRVEKKGFADSV